MRTDNKNKLFRRVFLGAFALIRNPDTWTQKEYAKDSDGYSTEPRLKAACSYCSLGAIIKFRQDETCDASYTISEGFTKWCNKIYDKPLHQLNDESSHDEIVQVWINYGKHMKYLPETFTVNDPTPEV